MADPAKIEAVLALIEAGQSERSACDEVGINRATFRAAALRFQAGDHYARAIEALARDQVDKIEDVITDLRNGVIDHNVARIEMDARKWMASKLFPKQYGDKVSQEHSGPNGVPLGLTVQFVGTGSPKPDEGPGG